jgi:hypothetical protein
VHVHVQGSQPTHQHKYAHVGVLCLHLFSE